MINLKTIYFLLIYGLIRLFSFYFSPETPLLAQHWLNTAVASSIFVITMFLLWRKDERGWYIVAGEIILGGGGGYLAIAGLSLRSALLLGGTGIYFYRQLKNFKIKFADLNPILLLILMAIIAGLRGIYFGHNQHWIFADFVPYLFLLYYYPLRELWVSKKFRAITEQMLIAAIIGNFVLIISTHIGLTNGWLVLQDSYYHWFRDVGGGKITELGLNFYRLTLNEHLLLAPLIIYLLSQIIKSRTWLNNLITTLLLTILSLNLTRIYILALVIGLILLYKREYWKKWLLVSGATLLMLFVAFTSLHLIASRGQSLGWELFGLRLQSIAAPQIENSSLSRMLLLPKILEKIISHPILGGGLGDSVTVYSPVFKTSLTTPHFDWGYLEIWAETGAIGLVIWMAFIIYLSSLILKTDDKKTALAVLMALAVTNLTSPAFFHVLGIILLVILLVDHACAKQSLAPLHTL